MLGKLRSGLRRGFLLRPLLLVAAVFVGGAAVLKSPAISTPAWAQTSARNPPPDSVPNFWDLQRRVEKPDTAFLQLIRFVTDDEYPPFGFTASDGKLAGFNVDLARAICRELKVNCTLQRRRFDTIIPAIVNREADAAIASLAITPVAREQVLFTHPYYRTPARFAAQKTDAKKDVSVKALAGKQVGAIKESAHAAYLKKFFPAVELKLFDTAEDLLAALKNKQVPTIFADGVTLAIWLNGSDADGCCAFRGGPYTESRYFGEGVGIAVNKNNEALRRVLDYALVRIAERGVYADIYLKYFPIGFY